MSDKIISASVTVKDILFLFGASMVVMSMYFIIMVSLFGHAINASFRVPVSRTVEVQGLECVHNCNDYQLMLESMR